MTWFFELYDIPPNWFVSLPEGKYEVHVLDKSGLVYKKNIVSHGYKALLLPIDPRMNVPIRLVVIGDGKDRPLVNVNGGWFELEGKG